MHISPVTNVCFRTSAMHNGDRGWLAANSCLVKGNTNQWQIFRIELLAFCLLFRGLARMQERLPLYFQTNARQRGVQSYDIPTWFSFSHRERWSLLLRNSDHPGHALREDHEWHTVLPCEPRTARASKPAQSDWQNTRTNRALISFRFKGPCMATSDTKHKRQTKDMQSGLFKHFGLCFLSGK